MGWKFGRRGHKFRRRAVKNHLPVQPDTELAVSPALFTLVQASQRGGQSRRITLCFGSKAAGNRGIRGGQTAQFGIQSGGYDECRKLSGE